MSFRDLKYGISLAACGLLLISCGANDEADASIDDKAEVAAVVAEINLDNGGQIQFFRDDGSAGIAAKFSEREAAEEYMEVVRTMSPAEVYEYYTRKPAPAEVQAALADETGSTQAAMSADDFEEYMENGIESTGIWLAPIWTDEWYNKSGSKSKATGSRYNNVLGIFNATKGSVKGYVKRKTAFDNWRTVCSITIDTNELGFVWGIRNIERTWKYGVTADSDETWHAYFWSSSNDNPNVEDFDWPF